MTAAGVELCHPCQRKIVLAGGLLDYLSNMLARIAAYKEPQPTFNVFAVHDVEKLSEADAWDLLKRMRWPKTGGKPVCPKCMHPDCYDFASRHRHKCKSCGHQFTVTSGTAFASRKASMKDLLVGIVSLSANDAPSARALALKIGVDVRSAWGWAKRLEAMQ